MSGAVRRRLKNRRPPAGFELIEEVIDDFEQQLRDAVNEDTEGRRRNESTWKVHRLHWEKNRFIHDLMYVRKVMSRELFDWLVREKVADGALIAKWRRPGYEILCSMLAIQRGAHNFGTTSHCRVPMRQRAPAQRITPDVQTGCICCASGDGRFGGPVWWNTPLEGEDDDAGGEGGNRTTWAQQGEEPAPEPEREPEPAAAAGEEQQQQEDEEEEPGAGPPPPALGKRAREEDEDEEDELDDAVKARLAALRGK